jgi:hypothetical protein
MRTFTFAKMNLALKVFGGADLAPQDKKIRTLPRISLVYSCDTMNEKVGKQGISEAVKFFFVAMEKRDLNPIGPMVLEHLKNHVDGLYRYFMKDKINEKPVGDTMTEEIHKNFCGGYNLIWGDWLNSCMVDYDIICIDRNCDMLPLSLEVLLNYTTLMLKFCTSKPTWASLLRQVFFGGGKGVFCPKKGVTLILCKLNTYCKLL